MKQVKLFCRNSFWSNHSFEQAVNEFLSQVHVYEVQMSSSSSTEAHGFGKPHPITIMIVYEGRRK